MAAELVRSRDANGASLVCRLVFALVPGTAALERRHAPCPTGHATARRRHTQVVVVGEAYPAPGEWHARLIVGSIDKMVPVHEASRGKRIAPALGPQRERADGVAPPDQRLDRPLRSDERILLEGLHLAHARFDCCLPGIEPQAIVRPASGSMKRVSLTADLLWIDADRGECVVEWRGDLPADAEAVFVADVASHAAASEEQIVATADVVVSAAVPEGAFDTLVTMSRATAPPLPFVGTSTPPPPTEHPTLSTGTLIGMSAVDLDGNRVAPPAMLGDPVALPGHSWELGPMKPAKVSALPVALDSAARRDLEKAARLGVAAVSAEAARQTHTEPPPQRAPKERERVRRLAMDLLWFEESFVGQLVEELGEDPEAGEKPARVNVAAILENAPIVRLGDLATIYSRAVAEESARRPLVCIQGTLSVYLRARDRLKRMSELAELFAEGDKRLRQVLDRIALASSHAVLPDDVIEAMRRQLQEAFGQSSRTGLAADYLESTVARSLLEDRAFVELTIMGGSHLRAQIEDVVLYLPKACAEELPLASRFRAQLLVELRSRQDERDPTPVSLKALAIAAIVGSNASRVA